MIEVIIVIWFVWLTSAILSGCLINKIEKIPVKEEKDYTVVEVGSIPFYILGPIGLISLVLIYLVRLNNK